MPFIRLARTLSRIRSAVTSRSNWAKDSRMFSVSRPIDVVVLKDCVPDTKVTPFWSNTSTSLEKSISERDRLVQYEHRAMKAHVGVHNTGSGSD
jgi:hypothetical protein